MGWIDLEGGSEMADDNLMNISADTYAQRELMASNVRRIRTLRGWSQEKLAQLAQIDRTHLARFETRAINISIDVMFRLAAALRVDATRLLTPQEEWPTAQDGED